MRIRTHSRETDYAVHFPISGRNLPFYLDGMRYSSGAIDPLDAMPRVYGPFHHGEIAVFRVYVENAFLRLGRSP